jgi:ABC-type transport system involved in multi-copper enzyme maturation permease subunit
MGKIKAIALNTFKEAVRNKVLYFLLIFAILIMGFSSVISDLAISASEKLIKDLGLASIDFFGFLIAVFVGVYLVYNELDKKTIYTIVSKPIDRHQFILGKFFGLLLTIYVNVIIMSLFFFAVLYFRNGTQDELMNKFLWKEISPGNYEQVANFKMMYYWFYIKGFLMAIGKSVITFLGYSEPFTAGLIKVVAMSSLGLAIITAFAIFYSTFSTPTLSAVFTSLTFVIGSLCEDIIRYADRLAQKVGGVEMLSGTDLFKYRFAVGAAHIVPNLSYFDKRTEAIYGSPEIAAAMYPRGVLLAWEEILYGVTYTAAILALASIIFRRRNFK